MTQDIEDSLRKLSRQFADSLPQRFAAIETELAQCRNGSQSPNTIETLHLLVHGLSGSGAIFGFTALSAAALELETKLEVIREQKCDIKPPFLDEIETLWAHVRQAAMAVDLEKAD